MTSSIGQTPLRSMAQAHSPVQNAPGMLSGRTVQQTPAQAPRIVSSGPFSGIKSLFSRMLNAVTPDNVRASQKQRDATTAVRRDVQNLCQLLTTQSTDTAKVLHSLQSLGSPNEVLSRLGISTQLVVVKQLNALLDNMTPADRRAVRQGLEGLGNLPIAKELLCSMEDRAIDIAVEEMQADIDLAMVKAAVESRNKGGTLRAYQQLYEIAGQVLREQGFSGLGVAREESAQRLLVMNALEQSLVEDPANMGRVINLLPSKELHKLANETSEFGSNIPFGATATANGAVGLRHEKLESQLEQQLNDLTTNLLATPNKPQFSPQDFAAEIADIGETLTNLRELCDTHHLNYPVRLDGAYAALINQLETSLTPNNLALNQLSHEELHAMAKGLEALGIEVTTGPMAAERQKRIAAVENQYSAVMTSALVHLSSDNATDSLRDLKNALRVLNDAVTTHAIFGKQIEAGDARGSFAAKLVSTALNALSDSALQGLSSFLESDKAAALYNALADVGSKMLESDTGEPTAYSQLGRSVYTSAFDLDRIRLGTKELIEKRQLDAPSMPNIGQAATAVYTAETLLEVYGIAVNTDGSVSIRRGVADESMQDSVQSNLDAIVFSSKDPEAKTSAGAALGVSRGFIKDLPRADYSIQLPGGQTTSLFNRASANKDAETDAAISLLQQLNTANPALLLRASRLANQNILAGINLNLLTPDSPLQLPDGTPGAMQGAETTSFHFKSDGAGGILLHVNYDIKNATEFTAPPRNPNEALQSVALDRNASNASFTMALRIDSNNDVSIVEPLHYVYNIAIAP